MLQTIIAPNAGHPVVHHLAEGAAVWGQAITASIAHLIQRSHEIDIDFARIGAGIVFQCVPGLAMLPHVLGEKAVRLQVETAAFRKATGSLWAGADAIAYVGVGDGCTLKLWGHIALEDPSLRYDKGMTIPAIFTLSFWEVSRTSDARLSTPVHEMAGTDRKIRELEAIVALAMCSQ